MEEKLNELIDRIEYFIEKDIDTWNREDWHDLDVLNDEICDMTDKIGAAGVTCTETLLEKIRLMRDKVHICVEKLQE